MARYEPNQIIGTSPDSSLQRDGNLPKFLAILLIQIYDVVCHFTKRYL